MAKEPKVTKPEGRPKGKNPSYTKEEKKELLRKFLKHYKTTGNITHSAEKVGLKRKTILLWIEQDPKMKEKFDDMHETYVDSLEMVAHERAVEKSDTLLLALLRANRKEKYAAQAEHKVDAKVDQQSTVKLVFSKDEWGEMPNYANMSAQGGEPPDGGEEETDTDE